MKTVKLRNTAYASKPVGKLSQTALVPDVSDALLQWAKLRLSGKLAPGVLIGSLAMSFYTRPRDTTTVDILFLSDEDIPMDIPGFKPVRKGVLQENKTHVEIETRSAFSINVPESVVRKVFDTSHEHGGLRVASREALIVLRLWGSDKLRREYADLAAVQSLLTMKHTVDVTDWILSATHKAKLTDCLRRSR